MSPSGQEVAKGLSLFDEKMETTARPGVSSWFPRGEMDSQVLLRIFYHRHDFGIGAEFFVVAIANVFVQVDALEQNARVELQDDRFGQPDFVVDSRLLNQYAGSFVHAGNEPAD